MYRVESVEVRMRPDPGRDRADVEQAFDADLRSLNAADVELASQVWLQSPAPPRALGVLVSLAFARKIKRPRPSVCVSERVSRAVRSTSSPTRSSARISACDLVSQVSHSLPVILSA